MVNGNIEENIPFHDIYRGRETPITLQFDDGDYAYKSIELNDENDVYTSDINMFKYDSTYNRSRDSNMNISDSLEKYDEIALDKDTFNRWGYFIYKKNRVRWGRYEC